jgi:hypothetical protein
LARRRSDDAHYGMDITQCVKRNNIALAQYEEIPCCTAQKPAFPACWQI